MRDSVSIGAKHPATMIFDCALVIRCGTDTVQEMKNINLGNLKTLFFALLLIDGARAYKVQNVNRRYNSSVWGLWADAFDFSRTGLCFPFPNLEFQ